MFQKYLRYSVTELHEGMVLGESVFDVNGKLLLYEGVVLKEAYIEKIRELGLRYVRIVDTEGAQATADCADDFEMDEALLESTRKDAFEVVEDIMSRLAINSKVDTEKLYLVVSQIIDEVMKKPKVTFSLASLRKIDDYIFQHSINTCVTSIITGVYMGFNKVRLVNLGIGAMLHDVGKVLMPMPVLNKPERLEMDEFEVIKTHTIMGYESLHEARDISIESKTVLLQHHERFDGKGYPYGISGDSIHVFSKIVSVADVFDAITSDRVYSLREDPYFASIYLLEEMGAKFDPDVVKVFLKIIGYYPVGLHVELNTGAYGIIVRKNRDKPTVRILVDENKIPVNFYFEIDLAKNPTIAIMDIDPVKGRMVTLESENTV